ncbi:pirin family protein [Micrococcus sp.]|uniref:pirin family protein n=1 Tax=Micrococcus sp. TaxID=1271 RepID=UPI002A91918B|nr:pirin family protein [Micrococcus sp.]MDY6055779.1 pirin family protein [Micrococcus sp.]
MPSTNTEHPDLPSFSEHRSPAQAGGLREEFPAARFTEGLSSGVTERQGEGCVVEVLEPREVPLGGPRAMTVLRTLPQRARSLIGAWCFLDFYGPEDVSASGGMDVPRHPHTGLATVSWLFEGRIDHVDSAGSWAAVRPGEVNLMNAGRGITHSEYSTQDTTVLHGAQLWYALPEEQRSCAPGLESHRPEPVTGEGWEARVFLGELLGTRSPVSTALPLTGVEVRLEPGAELRVPVPAGHEHGLLCVSGPVSLQGVDVPRAHVGYVAPGAEELVVRAGAEAVVALLLGGEPLGEQIIMWWNFVGRTQEEIETWRAAYMQEMGFEAPTPDSPLAAEGLTELRGVPDGEPLGRPVGGALLDALVGTHYDDGRPFPQFGAFPPDPKGPIPAPTLPNASMRPRG